MQSQILNLVIFKIHVFRSYLDMLCLVSVIGEMLVLSFLGFQETGRRLNLIITRTAKKKKNAILKSQNYFHFSDHIFANVSPV